MRINADVQVCPVCQRASMPQRLTGRLEVRVLDSPRAMCIDIVFGRCPGCGYIGAIEPSQQTVENLARNFLQSFPDLSPREVMKRLRPVIAIDATGKEQVI